MVADRSNPEPTAEQRDRLFTLLWDGRAPATRGPRPSLSVLTIARTTVELADREDLGAVSMQRVADILGVTKMALYRYVASKQELLAVTIEEAVGEPPNPARLPKNWRAATKKWARMLHEIWVEHPWLPGVTVGDRAMGPREVGWIECAVAALDGTGLDGAQRMDTVQLLFGHVRSTRSATVTGTQPWTATRHVAPDLRRRLDQHSDDFPAILAATESVAKRRGNAFTFGLDIVLDGVETLIAERAGS